MIDHSHFEKSDFDGDHTLLLTTNFQHYPAILGSATLRPVLFEGIGMKIDHENTLAFKLLAGSETAYSGSPERATTANTLEAGGSNSILMAALQGKQCPCDFQWIDR